MLSPSPNDATRDEPSLPVALSTNPWRFVVAITVPVWAFLTLSRVATFNLLTAGYPDIIIAPPQLRALQHLLLLPLLLVFYRIALGVGWPSKRRLAAAGVHLALALTFALAARPVLVSIVALDRSDPTLYGELFSSIYGAQFSVNMWVSSALDFFMLYCFGLLVLFGVHAFRSLRDQQLQLAKLEQAWSRARLQSLRMQLNPHFLFNALNTAVSLVRTAPERAEETLIRVSDLLRVALRDGARDFTTVEREVELTRGYLEVQCARMADRLKYSITLDSSAAHFAIPSLLMQPLVENAVLHASASDLDFVEVTVRVGLVGQNIEITIINTAPTGTPQFDRPQGIGLRNTRERLATIYGAAHSFQILAIGNLQVEAQLIIPARRAISSLPRKVA
jgi:hypothetical protein